jgi:hypothetical protein
MRAHFLNSLSFASFETPKTFLKANVRPINLPLGTKMVDNCFEGLLFS